VAYLPIAFSGAFLDENAEPIAGATVTVTIRNASGTAVVTAAAATERTAEGGSYYEYVYTPVADTTYTGVMSTTDPDATQAWLLVGSATAEQDSGGGGGATAEEIWSYNPRTLTSPTLYFQAPFAGDSETLTLVRGDSYTSGDDNRPLQWSSAAYPVLTGGTIALLMRSVSAPADVVSYAGTVVDASTAQVELTSTQTGALDTSSNKNAPAYEYALVATLADASVVTLARGNVIVRRVPTNL
jgi:hypothetical protein